MRSIGLSEPVGRFLKTRFRRLPLRAFVRPALHFDELESRLTPTAPVVLSIDHLASGSQFINQSSVAYAVTFDQPVVGVDAADFKIVADNTLTFHSPKIAEMGATYT